MILAKSLQKGDLIIVSYNNHLSPAIYIELGCKGNPKFYTLYKHRTHIDYTLKRIQEGKSIHKSYIYGTGDRIAKISKDDLPTEYLEYYTYIIDYLKLEI
jgi:hypothetical protein